MVVPAHWRQGQIAYIDPCSLHVTLTLASLASFTPASAAGLQRSIGTDVTLIRTSHSMFLLAEGISARHDSTRARSQLMTRMKASSSMANQYLPCLSTAWSPPKQKKDSMLMAVSTTVLPYVRIRLMKMQVNAT